MAHFLLWEVTPARFPLFASVRYRQQPSGCYTATQGCRPLPLRPHERMMEEWFGWVRRMCRLQPSFRAVNLSLPPRGRGTTKWWKELYGTNDQGEENNYISGNSEIISSKNVSSRGLLHPLRGSPLPEGAKVATSPNVYLIRSINPNLKTICHFA